MAAKDRRGRRLAVQSQPRRSSPVKHRRRRSHWNPFWLWRHRSSRRRRRRFNTTPTRQKRFVGVAWVVGGLVLLGVAFGALALRDLLTVRSQAADARAMVQGALDDSASLRSHEGRVAALTRIDAGIALLRQSRRALLDSRAAVGRRRHTSSPEPTGRPPPAARRLPGRGGCRPGAGGQGGRAGGAEPDPRRVDPVAGAGGAGCRAQDGGRDRRDGRRRGARAVGPGGSRPPTVRRAGRERVAPAAGWGRRRRRGADVHGWGREPAVPGRSPEQRRDAEPGGDPVLRRAPVLRWPVRGRAAGLDR